MLVRIAYTALLVATMSLGCGGQDKINALGPKDFQQKMLADSHAMILDVRTINEIAKGFIPGASHIDYNQPNFSEQLKTIDRHRHIYVYCASGARSHAAAKKLQALGFAHVNELEGGILAWRMQNLPVTTPTAHAEAKDALSEEAFKSLVNTNPLVLVDFYAPWCAPRKIMKPALDSMEKQMKDSVFILTLNADDHLHLMKSMQIETIPYVLLFKNGKPAMVNSGFAERSDMEAWVRKYY